MFSLWIKLFAALPLLETRRLVTFQINRGGPDSTVQRDDKTTLLDQVVQEPRDSTRTSDHWKPIPIIEAIAILICFALFAGQLPPDVNESHYLTKAKYFWNPEWCPGDIFLSSSFAHWLFFATAGLLTKFMPLSAVAWTGRVITWALLAFAWKRLNWRLIPAHGMALTSAMFFLLLNDRFHLAGEWVVGGFEAKGFAYFFVLLALGNMISPSWKWVWPLLGCAAAFHVLVGGWSFLAAIFVWLTLRWLELDGERNGGRQFFAQLKEQVLPFLAGAGLALVGAIPPLLADQSAPEDVATAARMIYVNHRIAHHLTFDAFPTLHVARFTLIVVFWFLLQRWLKNRWSPMYRNLQPVFLFGLGSLLISFGGLLLSGVAEQNQPWAEFSASLLRFYWFRLSDFAIPTGAALSCCSIIWYWLATDRRIATRLSCAVFLTCILSATGLIILERHQDPRPRADRRALPNYPDDAVRTLETYKNWRKVCDWIAENTPVDATFITPDQQQTFKWYAGRSEVVCWKDIPQDSNGILQWRKRLVELYEPQRRYESGLMSYSDEQLRELANRYGASYLLIPQRQVDLAATPTQLKQVYPVDPNSKSTYVVFEF